MKKFGFLIFAIAIIGSLALVSSVTGKSVFGFFNFAVQGSGRIVTEKRDASGFKGVQAGGATELQITVGKDFSVELEGDDNILPLVRTEVRAGVLHIERNGNFWSRTKLVARITMPEFDNLDLSGASRASVAGVDSNNVKLEASGASQIEISGTAQDLTASLSGASKLDAANLRALRANIDASGASKAQIFASESVTADTSGASKIVYAGNPATVNKDASGASSIAGS